IMLGFATATMVESTRIMKKPTIMAHSAFQGRVTGGAGRRSFGTGCFCGGRRAAGVFPGAGAFDGGRLAGGRPAAARGGVARVDAGGRGAGRPRFGALISPPRSG